MFVAVNDISAKSCKDLNPPHYYYWYCFTCKQLPLKTKTWFFTPAQFTQCCFT